MVFHNKTLLGGGSAPGTPLTQDEEKETERKLTMLTADPINAVFEDREFKMFKTKQFERAFPGKQPLDATGRGIDTPPVVGDVEPFKPTLRRDDLNLSGSVGEEARNRPAEVIRVKKALANTGLFDFDVTREKSTDAGPQLTDATKAFQRLNGIEPDGCIKPNCPTHKALNALFFPEGGSNSKATPVDLRPAATRAEAAATGAGSSLLAQSPTPTPTPAPTVKPPAQPPAAAATAKNPWPQSPVSTIFREEIHKEESRGLGNYGAVNRDNPAKPALGRYQLRPAILQDIGMKDAQGNWIGKYGVTSESDFLKNPLAQEKAFADALAKYEVQLRRKGALQSIGQQIDGLQSKFTVTDDGLIAAAHREGAGAVNSYLRHQRKNGWKSNFSSLPPITKGVFEKVETRLREFEKVRRRKTVAAP